MPTWIQEGFTTYAKRMPKDCSLELVELELGNRSKKNYSAEQAKRDEQKQFEKHLNKSDFRVALDVLAKPMNTEQLATNLENWRGNGSDVAILIGGPDGLSEQLLASAQQNISLSKLPLPHALVRVIFAEQIYRAWTVLNGHPYHRA